MKSIQLHEWAIPSLDSLNTLSCRSDHEKAVAKRVNDYFAQKWPWSSDEEKVANGCSDVETWSMLCCPKAPEARAELASMYTVFLFNVDDYLLEVGDSNKGKEIIEAFKGVMLNNRSPQNPIETIFYDICTGMQALSDESSADLLMDLHNETIKFMESVVNQEDRRTSLNQGLEAYLKYRAVDIGFLHTLYICQWELNLAQPRDDLWRHPDFVSLISLACTHETLVNDLYSYFREARTLEEEKAKRAAADESTREAMGPITYFVYNAVCVLLLEDGVDEGNVYNKMIGHIHNVELEFYATVEKLKGHYKDKASDLEVIQSWVSLLIDIMAGNHVWSIECRRYQSNL